MRTRRRGRWLLKQPRLGARMCQGTFFLCPKGRGYPVKEKPFGRIPDRHIAVQRTFLQIERRLKNEFFMANRI